MDAWIRNPDLGAPEIEDKDVLPSGSYLPIFTRVNEYEFGDYFFFFFFFFFFLFSILFNSSFFRIFITIRPGYSCHSFTFLTSGVFRDIILGEEKEENWITEATF